MAGLFAFCRTASGSHLREIGGVRERFDRMSEMPGASPARSICRMSKGPKAEPDRFAGEGGHMSAVGGRVVHCPDADRPFKVILTRHAARELEHSFATMREAEDFIRRNAGPRTSTVDVVRPRRRRVVVKFAKFPTEVVQRI